MRIHFNGISDIATNDAIIANPTTLEHERIGAVYQNAINYLNQDMKIPDSIWHQLGVRPQDEDAVMHMTGLIRTLADPHLNISIMESIEEGIPQNSGAFLIRRSGDERVVGIFKIGAKRASLELIVRRIAHQLGLERHTVPGMFCALTGVDSSTLRGATEHLFNGLECEYKTGSSAESSSSESSDPDNSWSESDVPSSMLRDELEETKLKRSFLDSSSSDDTQSSSSSESNEDDIESSDWQSDSSSESPQKDAFSSLFKTSSSDSDSSSSELVPVEDPVERALREQFNICQPSSSSAVVDFESTTSAVVGFASLFLYPKQTTDEDPTPEEMTMQAALTALLAVAVGLQDGKPDGLIYSEIYNALTLFDVEYCMSQEELDLPEECTREMVENRVSPLDIPFLADQLFNAPLSIEQVKKLALLVDKWKVLEIFHELKRIPIQYADPIAEQMQPGSRGMNQAASHIKIESPLRSGTDGIFDRWNGNPERQLLSTKQIVICHERLSRLQTFIVGKSLREETFKPSDLLDAVDRDGKKIADALKKLPSFLEQLSRFSPLRATGSPSRTGGSSPDDLWRATAGRFSPHTFQFSISEEDLAAIAAERSSPPDTSSSSSGASPRLPISNLIGSSKPIQIVFPKPTEKE